MAQLLFILVTAGIIFAFSSARLFAVYGCLFLIVDLLYLVRRVDGHSPYKRHFSEDFARNLEVGARMEPSDLDADVCREANAALLWLNGKRALDGIPALGALCILGFALLGLCIAFPPVNSSWGALGIFGVLLTGLNVIYYLAIQFCDWRLNVHMRRACAIWL